MTTMTGMVHTVVTAAAHTAVVMVVHTVVMVAVMVLHTVLLQVTTVLQRHMVLLQATRHHLHQQHQLKVVSRQHRPQRRSLMAHLQATTVTKHDCLVKAEKKALERGLF